MRQAIKARAIRAPEVETKVTRRRDRAALQATFVGRTFEDLTKPEKETLLKVVAIRLGLVEPS